jgi:hypothetical protein
MNAFTSEGTGAERAAVTAAKTLEERPAQRRKISALAVLELSLISSEKEPAEASLSQI